MPRRKRAGAHTGVGLVVSCEHGGNRVPAAYRALFRGGKRALDSHRGWDPGALELARAIRRDTGAPLVANTVSRLLVECNRSIGHPRVFSEFTQGIPRAEKQRLLDLYYHPHRGAVEAVVRSALRTHARVVHVGVHTFTAVLHGRRRAVDVGLLYDPRRPEEAAFCEQWMKALAHAAPKLRVRRNHPYRGSSDGLTTTLRGKLPPRRYLGIELEVNQALLAPLARWNRARAALVSTLAIVLDGR